MSATPLGTPSSLPRQEGSTSLYLHPGQVAAFSDPVSITTVLGSCIAVCLWDDATGVGGMNHFVLPEGVPGLAPNRMAEPACASLLERLVSLGATTKGLRAKVFGGASLLPSARSETTIGQRNIQAARRFLFAHGVPVLAEDVGGPFGRKLIFSTSNGIVWVRLLRAPQ